MSRLSFLDALTAPLTAADYDGHSEDDWAALITYLHGEGTPAERAAMAYRLAHEPALAASATSIRVLWQTPSPVRQFDVVAGLRALRASAAALPPVPLAPALAPTARPPRRPSVRFVRAHWGPLAAGLLLGWLGLHALSRHHQAPGYHYHGGTAGVTARLPDGTQATLTPGSYLGTAPGFPHGTRVVYLYGGAHFTVAPNPRVPFIVQTPGVRTRVLGTSFALQADTVPTWHLTVQQGAVALSVRDAAGQWRAVQTITAGQALHLPFLVTWMADVGHTVRAAGVPAPEAVAIGLALRRALIRLGAAAARDAARASG